jgi:hypothetical protein
VELLAREVYPAMGRTPLLLQHRPRYGLMTRVNSSKQVTAKPRFLYFARTLRMFF